MSTSAQLDVAAPAASPTRAPGDTKAKPTCHGTLADAALEEFVAVLCCADRDDEQYSAVIVPIGPPGIGGRTATQNPGD